MGRHREWRQVAKKLRRQRIRMQQAKLRENTSNDSQQWLQEQEMLVNFEYEQIENSNRIEHEKWIRADNVSVHLWNKLQEEKKILYQQAREREAKIKLEWEQEKELRKKEEERLKMLEEENKKKQETFMKKLEEYLAGNSEDLPQQLLISRETKPDTELCPFFSKTACCRFSDQCSRNHRYPGISKVLLATNFYTHFGLDNSSITEYDTDVMLEYEDSDRYQEFKEFFNDVVPEFEKYGRIVQFRVCNNYEKHLRGNTYIEFAELRSAVAAYRALHTRWYGGKQLSLQFCLITSWKNAICGLQSGKRCPKGRSCNFLHVFRNPNNLYSSYFISNDHDHDRSDNGKSMLEMLNSGLDVNFENGWPIRLAARYGSCAVVNTLIQCGANPHLLGDSGASTLQLAVYSGVQWNTDRWMLLLSCCDSSQLADGAAVAIIFNNTSALTKILNTGRCNTNIPTTLTGKTVEELAKGYKLNLFPPTNMPVIHTSRNITPASSPRNHQGTDTGCTLVAARAPDHRRPQRNLSPSVARFFHQTAGQAALTPSPTSSMPLSPRQHRY